MRDRLTTKDALVFIALSQQDLAGIYWMIWEPMMMSGVKAFQYLLDGIEHRTGQAALPHPALRLMVLPARGLAGQSMGGLQVEQPIVCKEGGGPALVIAAAGDASPS